VIQRTDSPTTPTGAVKVLHEDNPDGFYGAGPFLWFQGTSRVIPRYGDDSLGWEVWNNETTVTVEGIRRTDGVKRYISVNGDHYPLEAARQLGEALLAACSEAERCNRADA
jgi:hypothetical protein